MKILKKGSKGAEVTTLQNNLKALGYTIATDGIFGNDTERIVKRFQLDNGLAADGIVGSNTWSVIDQLLSTKPIRGIDVSHHNGIIDWNSVDREQAQFVFCKATQGRAFKDNLLATNFNELTRLNYIRGVYHFFTFKDVTAQQQVDNLLSCNIDFSKKGVLPAVLDVEWQQSDALNAYVKNNKTLCVNKIKAWLDTIQTATGKKPIIYTAKSFWSEYLGNPTGFENYPLWVASYRNDKPTLPSTWNDYAIWQYTESGTVGDITGQLDKNLFNGNLQKLRKLAGY
jgi:lysozyme